MVFGGRVEAQRRKAKRTSLAVVISAFQSTRGRTFNSNCGFGSMVSDTSSQSLGWRGKDVEVDLQALTAQVRKLRVRTFIFVVFSFADLGAEERLRRTMKGVCEVCS